MHREIGNPSLIEGFLPEGIGRNESLERIDRAVDWDRLAGLVNGVHSSPEGRKSYPPLMMVKVMLLQQWYGASDPAMEEALSGPAVLSAVRGSGASGPVAGPLDHQPVPHMDDGEEAWGRVDGGAQPSA